jgi:hypothetical protein
MNEEDKINQELLDTFQAADLIIKLDYLPDDDPSAIFWKEKYLNLLDDYTDLLKSQAIR